MTSSWKSLVTRGIAWRGMPLALVAAGVLARAAWLAVVPHRSAEGEALRVAEALAAGRGFADAFAVGSGPTAHLLPAGPLLGGLAYRLGPAGTLLPETILFAWTMACVTGTFLLLFRAFGHLGVPRGARLVALAACALAPAYFTTEAVSFRVWEGGIATLLGALLLERVTDAHVRVRQQPRADRRFPLALLAVAAALFFVHPPLGLGGFTCLALLGLTSMTWRANATGVAILTALLAVPVVPWSVRNRQVTGNVVPLRSNAGLELALANNPRAVDTDDPEGAFDRELARIHPTSNAGRRAEVRRVGEVAYAARLGEEATAWIGEHPAAAARLWLRHIRQMIVPDVWMIDRARTRLGVARVRYIQLAGILGIAGLLVIVHRRRAIGAYPTAMLAIPVLAMAPFQPVNRYTYIVYPLLTFAATGLALRRRDGAGPLRTPT